MAFKGRLFGGIVVLGALAGWYVWGHHAPTSGGSEQTARSSRRAGPSGPVPVTVATVSKASFPVRIGGLGTVQPTNMVNVRTRVDGQIQKIYVGQGQLVKAGDLLLQIDPRPYQAALDQATAKQQQDQASLENATINYQRDAQLAKQSFASKQTLDNEAAAVRQAQAQIAADQASVFSAQTQLGYTKVYAPISGRTSIRSVDVGNIAQAAGVVTIMTIAQVQPIDVNFTAPEGDLPRIYDAMQSGAVPVTATSTGETKVQAEGKLVVINNSVDTSTGTIQLKAEFPNQNNELWPGLSVDTEMLVATLKDVVVVPDEAVQHGPNGLFAFVVDKDEKAQMRPLGVGDSGGGKVVVLKGLEPGDRVVVAGQYRLQPGSPVSIDPSKTADASQEH
jgi:membrane fusion protein, multidrug efflux system